MSTARPLPEPLRPIEADPGALVDWARVRARVGFALRAVRRRPITAAVCFVSIAALGPASLALLPRTRRVEATLAASHDPVVSTAGEPVLLRALAAEDPASGARDAILRRDRLAAIAQETGLLQRALDGRSPVAKLRDAVLDLAAGRPRTREERLGDLVEALEKRLTVTVPGNEPGAPFGAPRDRIQLALEWADPVAARSVLEVAARGFVEAQRAREEAAGRDVAQVLEERAAELRREVEGKVARIKDLEAAMLRGNPALSRTYRAPQGRVPQEQELTQLRITLESRKAALAELGRLRQARAEELRAELSRERTAYGEQHPILARTRENLERAQAPSAESEALRAEIAGLEQEFARASERAARLVDDEDPALELERSELRVLLARSATLRDRLEAVRVESAIARAGFDRRYAFAVPPMIPRRPVRPIPALSILAGLLGGALLALFAAAALDLRSGAVLEAWQLERVLGLRVLGEHRT